MSAKYEDPPNADARRLALEIISTLVNIKKVAAEHLLQPAEVPADLIRRFLTERNPLTGEKRSKREAGSMLLEELAQRGQDSSAVRRLIGIAARWNSFHLAQDEYTARAVVQRAQELNRVLIEVDEHERLEHERSVREAAERLQREKVSELERQSTLLLAQYDHAASSSEPQARGYLLQDLLDRLFRLHNFPVTRAFQRNSGGEQIDGAFELEGWHYLVECRWRAKLADIRDLDGLRGQVGRSGHQTMAVFLSINGWSEHVVDLLKQNSDKRLFLMEGYELRLVLDRKVDFRQLLKTKVRALNIDAEPYFSVRDQIK